MSARLFVLSFSLWVVWAIRAHHILALPVFVDESVHVLRAQVVYQFSDAVASFVSGKLLLNYYLGIFQPQDHNGIWLCRQGVALMAPLSAALCYAIVRHLTHSFRAGMTVIGLYALVPYMLFFERLALADAFTAVFVLAVILASLHFARRPHDVNRGAVVGMLMGGALLAKMIVLPLVIVPPLTLLFFRYNRSGGKQHAPPPLRARILPSLILCYAVTGMMLTLPISYSLFQHLTEEKPEEMISLRLFTPQGHSRLEQIRLNLDSYADTLWHLSAFPGVLLIPGAAVSLWRGTPHREMAFLLTILAALWGFIVVMSANPYPRYLVSGYPIVLIAAAVPIARLPQSRLMAAGGVMAVAWLAFSLPFAAHAWNDPVKLNPGTMARGNYQQHNTSGYALRDAAADLPSLESRSGDIPVTGLIVNCESLRLYLPEKHHIRLYCPYLPFQAAGIFNSATPEWTHIVSAAGVQYFLVDSRSIDDLTEMGFAPELVQVYRRPYEGTRVVLYRVNMP